MKYEPQLATLVKTPPSGDEWLHEIKFDGYRIGCQVRGDRVTLTSRNGKDWTAAFPAIVDAARRITSTDVLLDGEVAAVLPDGRTSFQAMQQRDSVNATIVYFVFDLLYLEGVRVASLPLKEWTEFLSTRPQPRELFELAVMRGMGEIMAHTITLHLLDAPGRVHRFMRKHPELVERIPSKELASYLNLSAETLSRLRKRGKI